MSASPILSSPGAALLKIKLATLSVLLLVAGVCSGLMYLGVMSVVACGNLLLRSFNSTRLNHAALDQISTVSLLACSAFGLIVFILMAWGATRNRPRAPRPVQVRARGAKGSYAQEGQIKVWVNRSA
jgi:hypothetical protein